VNAAQGSYQGQNKESLLKAKVFGTFDLLVKIACFVKKFMLKAADLS
jgi:hypothetical protein